VSALAEALVAFQAEMPTVHKGKTAKVETKTGPGYRYTYADLADIMAAAAPILTKHGLSFSARPHLVEQGAYELVGMLRHTSGEHDEGALPIYGRTPQELGSSLTYARRYLLGCLTGIVTDDDDDAQTAQPAKRTRRQEPPTESEAKPATRTMSRTPKAQSLLIQDDGEAMTGPQQAKMMLLFHKAGVIQSDTRHQYIENVVGRPVVKSTEITKADASKVIDALEQDVRDLPPDDYPEPPL
jgi:hypothetical protein